MQKEMQYLKKYGFELLTGSHASIVDRYALSCDGALSSWLNSASLIGWSRFSAPYYCIVGDALCLLIYETKDDVWLCAPPLCSYQKAFPVEAMQVLEGFFADAGRPFRMDYIKEWMLPFFEARHEYAMERSSDAAYSDYIYTREDFAAYLNKSDIRYNVRHCQRKIDPMIEWQNEDNQQAFLDLLKSVWCPYHSCEDCVYGCMIHALEDMLLSAPETGLAAFLVRGVDKKHIAYSGYVVCGDEAVVLVKKVVRSVRGLTDYVHKVILEALPEHVKYINYTEDMGNEGMRVYKQNLAPHVLSANDTCIFRRI